MSFKEKIENLPINKLNYIYTCIVVVIMVSFSITFYDNILINHWEIVISVFIPIIVITIMSYFVFRTLINKRDNKEKNK